MSKAAQRTLLYYLRISKTTAATNAPNELKFQTPSSFKISRPEPYQNVDKIRGVDLATPVSSAHIATSTWQISLRNSVDCDSGYAVDIEWMQCSISLY